MTTKTITPRPPEPSRPPPPNRTIREGSEAKAAKERQRKGGRPKADEKRSGKLPDHSKGDTRDKVAEARGVEFRITTTWPATNAHDPQPTDALKALVKILGRRFGARCQKCSVLLPHANPAANPSSGRIRSAGCESRTNETLTKES